VNTTVALIVASFASAAFGHARLSMLASVALLGQVLAPDPEQTGTFLKLLLDAVSSRNWPLLAALVVVLAVYLVRRFATSRIPWLGTDRGGAVLVLVTSLAGAVATAQAGGAGLSLPLLVEALSVALSAAGGFNLAKKLLTAPQAPAPAAVASAAPVPSPMDIVNGGQ
jgi:hypothetical protein